MTSPDVYNRKKRSRLRIQSFLRTREELPYKKIKMMTRRTYFGDNGGGILGQVELISMRAGCDWRRRGSWGRPVILGNDGLRGRKQPRQRGLQSLSVGVVFEDRPQRSQNPSVIPDKHETLRKSGLSGVAAGNWGRQACWQTTPLRGDAATYECLIRQPGLFLGHALVLENDHSF